MSSQGMSDADPCTQVPYLETFLYDNVDPAECGAPADPSGVTYYGGRGGGGSIRTTCTQLTHTCVRKCKAGLTCSCGQDYEIGESLEVCIEGSSGCIVK